MSPDQLRRLHADLGMFVEAHGDELGAIDRGAVAVVRYLVSLTAAIAEDELDG